ncbi:arylsulfatase, partial [Mycobacterium kansasii]
KIQWRKAALPEFTDDRWELYDLRSDYSQATDLAAERPDKLAELKALFDTEAAAHNVFPLDDRGPIRAMGARPTILGERSSISF